MNNILIKSIWKRRKKNRLLLLEFLISFLVLFGIGTAVITILNNKYKPLGFEYENVWKITSATNIEMKDTIMWNEQWQIVEKIKTYDEVEYAVKNLLTPIFEFSFFNADDFSYNDEKNIRPRIFATDDDFAKAFNLNIIEGRWYDETDNASKYRPIVINKALKDEVFGNRNAVGEIVKTFDQQELIIVGVIDYYRYLGDYSNSKPALFARHYFPFSVPYSAEIRNTSSNFGGFMTTTYVKVKPGTGAKFEEELLRDLATAFPHWVITFTPVKEIRKIYLMRVFIPLVIVCLIAAFLVLNVILGLFGILWYNISLRRAEIGLRMAIGSSKNNIYNLFIQEMLILATFGILPGILIAVQFPAMNALSIDTKVYVLAILFASAIIYALVFVCAFFPSKQATNIQPAVALRDE